MGYSSATGAYRLEVVVSHKLNLRITTALSAVALAMALAPGATSSDSQRLQ